MDIDEFMESECDNQKNKFEYFKDVQPIHQKESPQNMLLLQPQTQNQNNKNTYQIIISESKENEQKPCIKSIENLILSSELNEEDDLNNDNYLNQNFMQFHELNKEKKEIKQKTIIQILQKPNIDLEDKEEDEEKYKNEQKSPKLLNNNNNNQQYQNPADAILKNRLKQRQNTIKKELYNIQQNSLIKSRNNISNSKSKIQMLISNQRQKLPTNQQQNLLKQTFQTLKNENSIQVKYQQQHNHDNQNLERSESKITSFIDINYKGIQFIKKLIKRTETYRFNKLKQSLKANPICQDQMIDISAYLIDQEKQIKFYDFYISKFSNFLDKNIKLFALDNVFLMIFDILLFFYYILEIWNSALRASFYHLEGFQYYIVPDSQYILACLIILKAFLSQNTGIYIQGIVNVNRINIVKNYLQNYFIIDLLCLIQLPIKNRYLSLVFWLQIHRLQKIFSTIDMNFQISIKLPIITKFARLIILILTVAHLCSCGFILIQNIDPNKENSIINEAGLHNESWYVQYINTFYFSVITMSTIGYGDISPVTSLEKIFGIIVSFLACGVFAFCVNMVGSIFQEKAYASAQYNENRQNVIKYMKQRNISKQNQTKVLKYMEYQFKVQNQEGSLDKGQKVINSVSQNIRGSVYKEFYSPILKSSEIISLQFSSKFIERLSLFMNEARFTEGEIIYEQGVSDDNLYYLTKGVIEIYHQNDNNKTNTVGFINENNFFGYESFFLENRLKDENIRSQGNSQILYIKQSDFHKVLNEFPKEYENFKVIQEKLMFEQQGCGNYRKCHFCQTNEHNTIYCKLLHYIPYIEKIKYQVNQSYNKEQQRLRYFRDNIRQNNILMKSLIGKSEYRESAIDVRKDIVYDSKKYKFIDKIFDEVDENDDKSFMCFTPLLYYDEDKNCYFVQEVQDFIDQIDNYLELEQFEESNNEEEEENINNNNNFQQQKQQYPPKKEQFNKTNKMTCSIQSLVNEESEESMMTSSIMKNNQNQQQQSQQNIINNNNQKKSCMKIKCKTNNLEIEQSNTKFKRQSVMIQNQIKLQTEKLQRQKTYNNNVSAYQYLQQQNLYKIRKSNTTSQNKIQLPSLLNLNMIDQQQQQTNNNNQQQQQQQYRESKPQISNFHLTDLIQVMNDQKEQKQFSLVQNIDQYQEYESYKPWNNITCVLQNYQKYQKVKQDFKKILIKKNFKHFINKKIKDQQNDRIEENNINNNNKNIENNNSSSINNSNNDKQDSYLKKSIQKFQKEREDNIINSIQANQKMVYEQKMKNDMSKQEFQNIFEKYGNMNFIMNSN